MFEGCFRESQQLTAALEELKDVVSVRSLEALFQWLYLRVVRFDIEDPTEHISAAMELVRLADKYIIAGLEIEMSKYIKDILIANPHPEKNNFSQPVNTNTYYLTSDHIESATFLRREHPVHRILAAASVEGYLRSEEHKFAEETQRYPSFGADLLQEVRMTLHGLSPPRTTTSEDPISGRRTPLDSNIFV
ncbi:uncharacterized protein N7529_009502 [Penicillium soppii]|uniref:uncharacterized protein n=1 Tax=Penicillium soppii TaxID=69789 RepID=UPI00254768CF|nr:uncharacterized protein N7529_009502 [Penicillium soppii]KAJ5855558.1 hypothetical protein N7529_009502 [Penicillium soppii]